MNRHAWFLLAAFVTAQAAAQPETLQNPPPDDRFKADILLVVAHPDDETAVGAYLARAACDEGKSVAIVYGNRGTGGGNTRGMEQAASMGLIREVEVRRAAMSLGIDRVWFLSGRDTPGQDVLRSLQEWRHGTVLEELVRIVRLTRPEVILTWLPQIVAGENHGDHQAAGVLATEAFDVAGDPTVFPAQVTPPRERLDVGNATEGLSPWQPKKLYFFSDASHAVEGDGPSFDLTGRSPSRGVSYIELALGLQLPHQTQGEVSEPAREAFARHDYSAAIEYYKRFRLLYGKAVVPCTPRGDVFEGVASVPAPYTPPPGYRPRKGSHPVIELGGPFFFYRNFWRTHGIEHIAGVVGAEVDVTYGSYLHVPLILNSSWADTVSVTIRGKYPPGWKSAGGEGICRLAPGESHPVELFVRCPAESGGNRVKLVWEVQRGGSVVGFTELAVGLVEWALPQ